MAEFVSHRVAAGTPAPPAGGHEVPSAEALEPILAAPIRAAYRGHPVASAARCDARRSRVFQVFGGPTDRCGHDVPWAIKAPGIARGLAHLTIEGAASDCEQAVGGDPVHRRSAGKTSRKRSELPTAVVSGSDDPIGGSAAGSRASSGQVCGAWTRHPLNLVPLQTAKDLVLWLLHGLWEGKSTSHQQGIAKVALGTATGRRGGNLEA